MKLALKKETVRSLSVKSSVRTGAVVAGDDGGIAPNQSVHFTSFLNCPNHIGNGEGPSLYSICGRPDPGIAVNPASTPGH